ncbi:hypothetical protein Tco_0883197 [Tanacetum coccineum]
MTRSGRGTGSQTLRRSNSLRSSCMASIQRDFRHAFFITTMGFKGRKASIKIANRASSCKLNVEWTPSRRIAQSSLSKSRIEFFLNGVFSFGFVGVFLAFTKSTVSISHILSNVIIPKSDGTQKFTDEVDELRAISGHMLGASRVQIPQNNLDNLQSIREEDGTSKTVDP